MALSRKIHRGYKKTFKWPFVVAIIVILAIAFGGYFLVSSNSKEANLGGPIDFIKNEPEPEPVVKKETAEIAAELEAYLAEQEGVYGYHVIELDDGRSFGNRDEELYTAASSIKVAMAAYLYGQIDRGIINPDTSLTYLGSDYEEGTGSLLADPVGSKYKVSYLLERMIVASDNVATNILTRTYGRSNMQKFIDNAGIEGIAIVNNDVTPKGMADLLQAIYDNELISEKNKELLLGHMKKSITPTRLVAGVPTEVEVAHKIGSWTGAMSDIAVVFYKDRPYVIAVYSEGVAWGETTDAVIAGISKRVYEFEKSF